MNDIQEIMKNLEMIEKKKRKKTMKDIFIGVKQKTKKTKTKKY